MSQIEVPYEEAKQQIIDEIQKNAKGYLATSEGDLVTVRRMGLISSGLTIWCITTDNSRKVSHIKANPNVAIAAGDFLQIEGVASMKGHPMDEENSFFLETFKNQLPELYERSLRPGRNLRRPSSRVIEVVPRRILLSVWTPHFDLEGFQPYSIILHTDQEKAYKLSAADPHEVFKASAYKE